MTIRLPSPQVRANFRALYLDVLWFGVLFGSTMAFVSIYATRLGATTLQISLLTAGPAIVNLFLSLPAGRWLEKRALIPATFYSAVLHRLGYVLLVPLPWFFGEGSQIWAIVFITLIMSIPGTVLAIGFSAVFPDLVPPEFRAEVVGKRNAIMAISLTASTLLSGQILDKVVFPLNYQVVFIIGVIGAALSTYYLARLHLTPKDNEPRRNQVEDGIPEPVSEPHARASQLSPRSINSPHKNLTKMLHLDLLRTSFGPFMLAYLLFYTFQYLGVPLFPLVQVRVLNLSDSIISLGSSLFYGIMLLVSLRIARIDNRLGHKRTLASGATIFAAYPLLLGLANGPTLFWAASAIGGGAWAMTNVGLINRLMEKVPDNQRPAGMALHNLILNLGILAGSLAAPLLGEWTGLQASLLVIAGLRLAAGIVFWIWG